MTNPPEQKAVRPEACPTCGSTKKHEVVWNYSQNIGCTLEKYAEFHNGWEDEIPERLGHGVIPVEPQPVAFVSDSVYSGPTCEDCGAIMKHASSLERPDAFVCLSCGKRRDIEPEDAAEPVPGVQPRHNCDNAAPPSKYPQVANSPVVQQTAEQFDTLGWLRSEAIFKKRWTWADPGAGLSREEATVELLKAYYAAASPAENAAKDSAIKIWKKAAAKAERERDQAREALRNIRLVARTCPDIVIVGTIKELVDMALVAAVPPSEDAPHGNKGEKEHVETDSPNGSLGLDHRNIGRGGDNLASPAMRAEDAPASPQADMICANCGQRFGEHIADGKSSCPHTSGYFEPAAQPSEKGSKP